MSFSPITSERSHESLLKSERSGSVTPIFSPIPTRNNSEFGASATLYVGEANRLISTPKGTSFLVRPPSYSRGLGNQSGDSDTTPTVNPLPLQSSTGEESDRSEGELESLTNKLILSVLRESIYNPRGPWPLDLRSYFLTFKGLDQSFSKLHDEVERRGFSDRIVSYKARAAIEAQLSQLPELCAEVENSLSDSFTYCTIRYRRMEINKDGEISPPTIRIRPFSAGKVKEYDVKKIIGENLEATRHNIKKLAQSFFSSLTLSKFPGTNRKEKSSKLYLEDRNDRELLGLLKQYGASLGDPSSYALWQKEENEIPLLQAFLEHPGPKKRVYIKLLLHELQSRSNLNPYLSKNIEQMIRFISRKYTRQTFRDILKEFSESRRDIDITILGRGNYLDRSVVVKYKGSTCRIPIKALLCDTAPGTKANLSGEVNKHIKNSDQLNRLSRRSRS
jgi:hypothetical protein